jgi:hypothetical protein
MVVVIRLQDGQQVALYDVPLPEQHERWPRLLLVLAQRVQQVAQ